MTLHNLPSAMHLRLESFLMASIPTKTSSLLCGGLKQLALLVLHLKHIEIGLRLSAFSTSKTLFMPIILISFGGTELERQWRAILKCSEYSCQNRCLVGADLTVSSPYGTQQLVICAQIAASQKRHQNISPDACTLEEFNYFHCLLLTLYHVWSKLTLMSSLSQS